MMIPVGALYIDNLQMVLSANDLVLANQLPPPNFVGYRAADLFGSSIISFDLFATNGESLDANSLAISVTSDGERVSIFKDASVDDDWDTPDTSVTELYTGVSEVTDHIQVRLARTTPFTSLDTITVEVYVELDGIPYWFTWSFTVEDLTAPVVSSVTTRGLRRLRVQFDEPVTQGTGEDGDALYVRSVGGSITVEQPNGLVPARLTSAEAVFEATDVGKYVGVANAGLALNNGIFEIAAFVSTKVVELVETGVRDETLPTDQLVVIAPYRVAGVPDSALKIPYFNPIVTAAETVTASEIELTLHTDITPDRAYTFEYGHVSDLFGNVSDASSLEFVTEALDVPQGRLDEQFGFLTFVPPANLTEDVTGDLERFLRCLDEVFQILLYSVDRFADLIDFDLVPDHLLDLVLQHYGNPFSFTASLSNEDKRRLLNVLVQVYKRKGQEVAIESFITYLLGVEVDVRPYISTDNWLIGVSELGYDTIMSIGTQVGIYSFEVVPAEPLDETTRARLIEIVRYLKPAHTHFVRIVEPEPVPLEYWTLDEDALDTETRLA